MISCSLHENKNIFKKTLCIFSNCKITLFLHCPPSHTDEYRQRSPVASLKAKMIKLLRTISQAASAHPKEQKTGAGNGAHCRAKQCCLYSTCILCQLGGMRKQLWESNPDLPHGTAETPIPSASPGNASPAWESKHSSMR